jgi:DNA replication protein DnaC
MERVYKKEKYARCDVLTQEIKNHFNKKKEMYIWGKTGIGKTHILRFLAQRYSHKGIEYFLINDMIQRFHEDNAAMKRNDYVVGYIERCKRCRFLFIDDLGNENISNYSVDQLVAILNYRNDDTRLKTVVSSNYSPKELYTRYMDKVGDQKAMQLVTRLKQLGDIEMKGKYVRNKYEDYKETKLGDI